MQRNKKGLLLVFIGPSGSGKGTVLKELLKAHQDTFLSVSATTRQPRVGEEDGKNYFFMTKEEFLKLRDNDGLLEHACYCDNFYGTPKDAVLRRLNNGENVVLEIEVQGAKQIKRIYPEAITLFILPPSLTELRQRLVDRKTEDEATINKRMNQATTEIEYAYSCDYVVLNDIVLEAVDKISAIMKAEHCKSLVMKDLIDKVLS